MFVVEPAVGDDADSVVRLAHVAMRDKHDDLWWARHLDGGECYVARDTESNKVLGFVLAERQPACEAQLSALAVEQSQRGRGVEAALLKTVQSRLRQTGTFRVHLEVRADDAEARDFYMSHGYQPEGVVDHAYEDGSTALRLSRPV